MKWMAAIADKKKKNKNIKKNKQTDHQIQTQNNLKLLKRDLKPKTA